MTWESSKNSWGGTCSATFMSRWFISSGETAVKWLLSSVTRVGSCSRSTFSCMRSSWLRTRLSLIIITTMHLCSSTGSRSNRLAVTCLRLAAVM